MSDPGAMTNAAMWAGIVGFFLPIAASVIIQQKWAQPVKAVAGFLCCVTAAVGTAYFTGLLDPTDVARCFLVVFTLAIAAYYGFWKPTGIAPKIEAATSF